MMSGTARPDDAPFPISALRIDFPSGGGYAHPAFHPSREAWRVDHANRIAYRLLRSSFRTDEPEKLRGRSG
ncbi:hypothetical protein ABID59_006447 [Bradyrhizobium sp. S3.3.6]